MSPGKTYPRKTCELGRRAVGPNPPKCLSPIVGVWEKEQTFTVYMLQFTLLPTLLSFLLPFFISSLLPLIFSFIPSSSTFLYCVLLCFSDFSYSLTSPLLPAILPPPFTQPLRPSFVLFNFISFNPPLRSSLILLINLFSNFLRVVHEADQFSLNPADVQCINTSVCFTQSACQLDETTSLHSVLHQDWGS